MVHHARTIERANDELQLLEATRANRQKRTQQGRFVVEGVRNVNAALEHHWPLVSVLTPIGTRMSSWATDVVERAGVEHVGVAPHLFDRLTDRDERPEVLLVAAIPAQSLPARDDLVVTVLDRIQSPGNLGTIIRTTDALGGHAVATLGHAASPYDPQCVRASTGSLFAVPVVEGIDLDGLHVIATDEVGDTDVDDLDVRTPCALLLGNERSGLSRALRDRADVTVRIPMRGTASSLNVTAAHAIVLHALARRLHP